MPPKRTRKGHFRKGATLLTVGSSTPTTTKGSYAGVAPPVRLATHDDHRTPDEEGNTVGRGVTSREGGLSTRAEWIRYQSGGITPSEILRQAGS